MIFVMGIFTFLTGDPINGMGTISGFLIFAMIGRKYSLSKMKKKANK